MGGASVASCDQLFEFQLVKIQNKVFEEIGFKGIITIAEHSLSCEVLAIMSKLLLNIGKLSIELILLCSSGGIQALVSSHYSLMICP